MKRSDSSALFGETGMSLIELIVAVGIVALISAIAVPMTKNSIGDFRLSGDARSLTSAVSLAKLRAASNFSQARVFVDLAAKTHHVETWNKTGAAWVTEGGNTTLATTSSFSFGAVGAAPPNSQATIGQASPCVTNLGAAIGGTACILFNSRGIPVDAAGAPPAVGAPTGNAALYVTDGTAVFGVTLQATGLIKMWRTKPTATPDWMLQ
jgi:prepilin-type N-terminal cleavage/methylation domain-containing protein